MLQLPQMPDLKTKENVKEYSNDVCVQLPAESRISCRLASSESL